MNNRDWDRFGHRMEDMIDYAINSRDFRQLAQNINHTIRQYKESMDEQRAQWETYETQRTENRTTKTQRAETQKVEHLSKQFPAELYANVSSERAKSIVRIVGGAVLMGGMTCGLLLVACLSFVARIRPLPVMAMLGGEIAGVGMLINGCKGMGRLKRFKKYIREIGTYTYCDFARLSKSVGKSLNYAKKDVKKMISKGWFLEGHVDEAETCLITSHDTYEQYQHTQKQMEQAKEERKRAEQYQKEEEKRAQKCQQEELKRQKEQEKNLSPEVAEVLRKGNEYIAKIRKCNDDIPGEEISNKIYKIEEIVRQIFKRAKEHPEVISDLKRLMEYYLPMTVKLLEAYADMDSQPIQGETIRNSKKEIEETLDTLNDAFEKLLDSIFQDTAWDISSDISVLNTILAQEGLKKSDFE